MADQRQSSSRFRFNWRGAGLTPPTTRSLTRSTPRQPQSSPSNPQPRPTFQPRGGTPLNTPTETKNEVEPQKLPREAEITPPPISRTTDSSQKSESSTRNSKEASKLAPQESSKPSSTSQPDLASTKPALPELKSKNPLEASEQTTLEKESTLLIPQETKKETTSSVEKAQNRTSPTSAEPSISTSNVAPKPESSTTKESTLLVPQETTNPTTSSPNTTPNIPTPTSVMSSISTSDVAPKTESSTIKEPALLVPQETTNPTTSSPQKTPNVPTPIPPESSISTSNAAPKPESSTTKVPALLVPQETTNPTTSSPETPQKPTPSNIESSISEEKPTQPKPKSKKLSQEGEKTLLATTRDVIKIVPEPEQKIINPFIGGDQKPHAKNESKDDNHPSSLFKRTGLDNPKYPIDGKQVTVITLAGENRGASMQLGSDAAKEAIHIHRGYKINQSEDINNNNNNNKSNVTKAKEDDHEGPTMRTLINNNVQSINNSIVLNSSVSKRDPGVQFAFPRLLREEDSVKSSERKETFDARKMQFEATPSHQVAYKPRIRRRCLKGLLMESSDSESDTPGKSRRHGCLYAGESKNDMDIKIN